MQYKVSRELGILLRKVHAAVRACHISVAGLRDSGLPDGAVSSWCQGLVALHKSIEQLSGIKELRTPLVGPVLRCGGLSIFRRDGFWREITVNLTLLMHHTCMHTLL